MSDPVSILPPNASDAERALETAIRSGRPDLSIVSSLLDAQEVAAPLLGWLAWALSVDEWDADWPEAVKRAVVASSIEVHRRKGTKAAVLDALASLGMEGRLSEWFEYSGEPHTFRIDVLIEEVFEAGFRVNPALVETVDTILGNVKPVRAHFDLRLGERFRSEVFGRTGHREIARDKEPRAVTPPTFRIVASALPAAGLRQRAYDRASFTPIDRSAA
ncbi:phage tail protein, P2 protein I family [Roseivivax halotolerans]|uniref:Phage tail protein, P2 protein I family n=1 Tax=Roseivivax halotolerans TaxID=93684 RepID=A0A1I5W407_9RHOB|nr:phage tail protein I [Roseivivax halotolerans]SFQ14468.1 phage tail protein, P2 protein I family [Roseivivax halotolerans]